VNLEKGLFHCFGCGVGGDVIRFVELIEEVDFKTAKQRLGHLNGDYRPSRRNPMSAVRDWAMDTSVKVAVALRYREQHRYMAQKVKTEYEGLESLGSEIKRADREIALLEEIYDGLNTPATAAGLWRERGVVEHLLEVAG